MIAFIYHIITDNSSNDQHELQNKITLQEYWDVKKACFLDTVSRLKELEGV